MGLNLGGPQSDFSGAQTVLPHAVADGAEIHAWNAPFEWAVWNNICVPQFGWPALPIERFHCTMATAACAGLPMSLDDASQAVGSSFLKDKAGHALMKRMARPRRFDHNHAPIWWHREDPLKLLRLIAYNIADVGRPSGRVHKRIPRMTTREREIWLVDQHMNQRGLPVDKDLLVALHGITLQELLRLNAEIARLTNGAVSGAAQNARLLEWARAKGYPQVRLARQRHFNAAFIGSSEFTDLSQDALQDVLFALRAEAAKTSTAKLSAIHNYAQARMVALAISCRYGGAVRTLRWAGRGPQLQNFPKPVVKHVAKAIEQILKGMDANSFETFVRPASRRRVVVPRERLLEAPDGFALVVCDYSRH